MGNDEFGRDDHSRLLWEQGIWARWIGLAWAAYGIAAFFRDEFLSQEVQIQYRGARMVAGALSIPLGWWAAGFVAVLAFWIFEASFRAQRESHAMLAAAEVRFKGLDRRLQDQLAESRDPQPTWSIKELFFHITPDVFQGGDEIWEGVGDDIRDKFSTGQIHVWGRKGSRRAPLTRILPDYWEHARFSYVFFVDGMEGPHSYGRIGFDGRPDYFDLQINRSEAERVWRH